MTDVELKILLGYLIIISLVTSCVTVADKIKAKNGKYRVRESTLFILAFLGGSAAEFVTMQIIRHKTRHLKFMVGLPLIFLVQATTVLFIVDKIP